MSTSTVRALRAATLALSLLLALAGCDLFDTGGGNGRDAGPPPMSSGVGDDCTTNEQCRQGLSCDATTETCRPTGMTPDGGGCTLSAECGEGLFCNAFRLCAMAGEGAEGEDCLGTGSCAAGLICNFESFGGRCRVPGNADLDDACTVSTDCLAGLDCAGPPGMTTCQSLPPFDGELGPEGRPVVPALPAWTGEECVPEDLEQPLAYFRVPRGTADDGDFYRLPFPNDVRRGPGGVDLSGYPTPSTVVEYDVLGEYVETAEADLDGFATNAVVYFRFSEPYAWGDINGETIRLVELGPDSPQAGQELGRSWLVTRGQLTRYICEDWLIIRTGHGAPLRPGTTYAAFITQGVRAFDVDAEEAGDAFRRSPDLDALLAEEAPSDAALAPGHEAYALFREWLDREDTPAASDVLNAAVFTTQDPRTRMPRLREAIRSDDAPALTDVTLCVAGVTSPCDDGEQRTCSAESDDFWEVHARLALPQFQAGSVPFETPEDGGGIELDDSGAPIAQRTDSVCLSMTIPKNVEAPDEGFPVLVYAHGTGGAFTAPVRNGYAAAAATGPAPAITVGLDMVLHGDRRGGSTRGSDVLVYNFLNPRAARDNFAQGAADLFGAVYWAEGFTLAAADAPTDFDVTFDPTRIVLFGHSQGANHAALMMPYEPQLTAVVLSGAGGDLTESLLTKTTPVNIARTVPYALLDVAGDGSLAGGDAHPALNLFQTFFESVDPVNYARHFRLLPLDGRPHVFMTYGLGDTASPERTLNAMARSARFDHVRPELVELGLTTLDPPVSGNVQLGGVPTTVAMRQYAPADGDDGHFVAFDVAQARADVIRFLQQALAGETPTIGE